MSEKIPDGKARKGKKFIETALARAFEKTPPTDEFRETLLKSGLDVAAFSADGSADAPVSNAENLKTGAVHPAKNRNEFLEAGLIQSPLEDSEEKGKTSLRGFGRWQHLTAIAGILGIIVLQSAFQFFFIQDENLRVAESAINEDLPIEKVSETTAPGIKEKAKIETETEYRKPTAEIPTQPKKAAAQLQREPRMNIPRPPLRKKETRESNAERLRRAEKILTGI